MKLKIRVEKRSTEILIVGAGPSGLSSALFLAQKGFKPRIIDALPEPTIHSKAFGVNPNTLSLLEPSGVTKKFIENGRKCEAFNLWRWKDSKLIFRNDLTKINTKYPFILVQSQADSEKILTDEISRLNIPVERNVSFQHLEASGNRVSVKLKKDFSIIENYEADYVIGADGAHSSVRKELGINFGGYKYDKEWELFDIELEMPFDKNEAHFFVKEDGGLFMVRIKENTWRIVASIKDVLNNLPVGSRKGKVIWNSKFKINNRVADHLQVGKTVLIGDAAHVHSPIGGRGMNLGVDDAFVLANFINNNTVNLYERLRRPYIKKTVRKINFITQVLAGNSMVSRFIRKGLPLSSPVAPLFMKNGRKFVMGLDRK